jgi:hypothetical protein
MESEPLYRLPRNVETRWITPENPEGRRGAGGTTQFGRKGMACRGCLKAGDTWTLAEGKGMGTIRRLWFTMSDRGPSLLRGIVLRLYWDGAATPAVEAPLGDFFGNPLGRCFRFSNAWFNNPEGRNWNCCLPMPFRKSFRITATNESPTDQPSFWYHVDYTLGERHGRQTGYFHAWYNRENPTTLRRDFRILPRIQGRGRFLGCTLGLITAPHYNAWWGEGEVKVYLDGDRTHPTLCGTGTEDYLCSSWGIGNFHLPWYGCFLPAVPDPDFTQVAMYRLHGPDPVYFHKEVRVDLQQIGYYGGQDTIRQLEQTGQQGLVPAGDGKSFVTVDQLKAKAPLSLFERQDDWSSVAYFYLDRPATDLPPIAPYADRVAGLTGNHWPASLAIKVRLARALRQYPALTDIPSLATREPSPENALKVITCLAGELDGVTRLFTEARACLRRESDSAAAEALRGVIAAGEKTGITRPAYRRALDTLKTKMAARRGMPIFVTAFIASPLQPAAPDIRRAVRPVAGLLSEAVPYMLETELADARGIHGGRNGLIYLQATIAMKAGGKGQLMYGADGPVKVWVNGKEADCRPEASNPAVIGEYVCPTRWRKGANTILFALNTNHGNAWGVMARASRK